MSAMLLLEFFDYCAYQSVIIIFVIITTSFSAEVVISMDEV
jgi:hypothetical protein